MLGFLSQTWEAQAFLTAAMAVFLGSLKKKEKKGIMPAQLCYCHPTQTVKLGKLAVHVYLNIAKAFPTGNLCVAYLSSIILQTLFPELLYIQLFRLACYMRFCYLSLGISTF